MVNARLYLIVFTLFPILTTLGLYSFLIPIEILSFSDDKITQTTLASPSIAQLPSSDEQSKFGYIILTTNIINGEKTNPQNLDFTIEVMGTNEPSSSFKAVQPPQIQVIPIKEGDYKISIKDAENSEIFLGEQCEGIMNFGVVKSCEINIDYRNEIQTLSVENQLTKHSLPLSELLSSSSSQIEEDEKNMLEIAQIPKPSDTSKVGFLIISTKVINNNGGNKQPADFTININGTPAFPPSFKAAPSNLIQIVSLTEGQYSVSVNDLPGYEANFDLQCNGQIDPKQIKSCLINIDDIPPTTSCPTGQHFDAATSSCVPDTNPPPISCPAGMHFDPATNFCEIDTPQPPITCPAGQHIDAGTNTCVPDTPQPPITCPAGQHIDAGTNTCVPDTTQPPPPSSGTFPVQNVQWYYDSNLALSKDITISSGKTAPNDPVLLSSGASGVKSHTIKNGWLEIQSGGGNGRVYWNYHDSPQFSQLPTAGFNTVMTGTFMLKPGIDNLSIKDGNHGTNGWSLDGQYVFGGFGLSIHRNEIQSKVEYWHNDQGKELNFPYPNGIKLVDNKEYKFFLTIRTDRTSQEVVLNVWLDFGDGKGWVHVMKDRKWGKNGWDPGNVPNGKDKEQIEQGPSFIKKHHIWTRANGDAFLPIKDVKIGTIDYIN